MPIVHAIVLGVVQGLSEFLPISSSGHLEIVPWLFGWDDFAGRPDVERAFDVAVHLGTLAGAIAYFRREVVRYAAAGLRSFVPSTRRRDGDERIAWLLVVSAVPAAVVGVALQDLLEGSSEDHVLIGVLLAVFGLVLFAADRMGGERSADDWDLKTALAMGIGQSLALQPGVSRSGVTITVGRGLGLDRDAAARLSFLMSIPVIAGAGLFSWFDLDGGLPEGMAAPFGWAMLAAGLTGYAAVWGTLKLVQTRTFTPFVVYRVAAGLLVVLVATAGWR